MRMIHKSYRELARDALLLLCVSGTCGIAVKLVLLMDQWVYLPSFPDVLDSAFLILSSLCLGILALRRVRK